MKRWLVSHGGCDERYGYYRTYFVNPGYFNSDKSKAKRFSWLGAYLLARKYNNSAVLGDKYYAVKDKC